MTKPQYFSYLRRRFGQHHGHRRLAVNRQAVGFIGFQQQGVANHALAGHNAPQPRHDRLTAGQHIGFRNGQRYHGARLGLDSAPGKTMRPVRALPPQPTTPVRCIPGKAPKGAPRHAAPEKPPGAGRPAA